MSRRSRAACPRCSAATKRLIAVRKSTLAFGRGTMTFIRPENRSVLCYVRQYQDEVILCVANLSRSAQATELDLSAWKGRIPLEMLGRTRFPAIGELPYMITLAPYGFYWFQLQERDKSAPVVPRGRARIRDAGGAAGRDLGVAGARRAACSSATCCRPIWRGPAGIRSDRPRRSSRR